MRNVVVFHTASNGQPGACSKAVSEDWFVRVQYDSYRDRHSAAHCLDVELDIEVVQGHYLMDAGPADGEAEIQGAHGGEHVWLREANPLPSSITEAVRAVVADEGLILQPDECAVLKRR